MVLECWIGLGVRVRRSSCWVGDYREGWVMRDESSGLAIDLYSILLSMRYCLSIHSVIKFLLHPRKR